MPSPPVKSTPANATLLGTTATTARTLSGSNEAGRRASSAPFDTPKRQIPPGLTRGFRASQSTARSTSSTGISASAGLSSATPKEPSRGTALNVNGKATFSTSGVVTVAAGKNSLTVNLAGVTASSMVLATAQQRTSAYVKAAVPGSGSFTIRLTGDAPSGGLKVAYFVLS
jgi:hypothetical protein